MTVTNDRIASKSRYKGDLSGKKELQCSVINLVLESLEATYDQTPVLKPIRVEMAIETPCITTDEHRVHDRSRTSTTDSVGVELAMYVAVRCPEPLQMSLNSEQFNILLQCVNLNLNYTDGLGEQFLFQRTKPWTATSSLKTRFDTQVPGVDVRLFDFENDWLIEFKAERIQLHSDLFWDARTETKLTADALFLYDRDLEARPTPMLYPREPSSSSSIQQRAIRTVVVYLS